ncbi:MAG: hypothetical protein JW882_09800 [Deltaproteobacteria bacterium]|nr:hypothetical protein [Deltaproteobacteria bacterium]
MGRIVNVILAKGYYLYKLLRLIFASPGHILGLAETLLFSEIRPFGRVHILLKGPNGEIKCDEWCPNLIVTTGKNHIADQMSDQGQAQMSHMAIGTGTTAAAAGDTALETELDRNALTSVTQSDNTVEYVGDWAAGDGTGAITEAGIFNAAAAGTMLCRSVFSVKNKAAGDTLSLTWVLTISV